MSIDWSWSTQLMPIWECLIEVFLPPTKEKVYVLPVFVCLSVCLSVCEQDYSKRRAWIWMKCCVSTDVGTWTNWLTFETDPDYSPDAETEFLSQISYALQRGILLRRENPTCRYWAEATRGFKMVSGPPLQRRVVLQCLYTASRRNKFVRGTCALLSALLVFIFSVAFMQRVNWLVSSCLSPVVCLTLDLILEHRRSKCLPALLYSLKRVLCENPISVR